MSDNVVQRKRKTRQGEVVSSSRRGKYARKSETTIPTSDSQEIKTENEEEVLVDVNQLQEMEEVVNVSDTSMEVVQPSENSHTETEELITPEELQPIQQLNGCTPDILVAVYTFSVSDVVPKNTMRHLFITYPKVASYPSMSDNWEYINGYLTKNKRHINVKNIDMSNSHFYFSLNSNDVVGRVAVQSICIDRATDGFSFIENTGKFSCYMNLIGESYLKGDLCEYFGSHGQRSLFMVNLKSVYPKQDVFVIYPAKDIESAKELLSVLLDYLQVKQTLKKLDIVNLDEEFRIRDDITDSDNLRFMITKLDE